VVDVGELALRVAQKNAAAHRFDKPPVQIPRLGIGEVDLLLFAGFIGKLSDTYIVYRFLFY